MYVLLGDGPYRWFLSWTEPPPLHMRSGRGGLRNDPRSRTKETMSSRFDWSFSEFAQVATSLALLVITIYLARRGTRIWVTAIPMVLMTVMTVWAMVYNITTFATIRDGQPYWLLLIMAIVILALEVWMIVESVIVLQKVRKRTPAAEPTAA